MSPDVELARKYGCDGKHMWEQTWWGLFPQYRCRKCKLHKPPPSDESKCQFCQEVGLVAHYCPAWVMSPTIRTVKTSAQALEPGTRVFYLPEQKEGVFLRITNYNWVLKAEVKMAEGTKFFRLSDFRALFRVVS